MFFNHGIYAHTNAVHTQDKEYCQFLKVSPGSAFSPTHPPTPPPTPKKKKRKRKKRERERKTL